MKLNIKTLDNKDAGHIILPMTIFGCDIREDIMARVVHWQRAKRRSGTASTKRIQDVQGTSKKPFRQKGTGNARQGSLRSPQMRGGATMHGPLPKDFSYSLPKKVRTLGLKSAFSAKVAGKKVIILDNFTADACKTKGMAKKLEEIGIRNALFIDGDDVNIEFARSISNLVKVNILPSIGANVYDIMRHETLVLSRSAVEKLEARLV